MMTSGSFHSRAVQRAGFGRVALAALLCAAAFGSTAAFAQDRNAQEKACSRDVSRYCRKVMNDGDQAIHQCLLQNVSRLSASCRQMLGQ